MASLKQLEANRRNALKSTGPRTEAGKDRSRRNAVRHGLTAETVIAHLEDADDYQAFELSVTSEFDATTAIERELVLRLASLLWRLRRATAVETGLLQIQSVILHEARQGRSAQTLHQYGIHRRGCGPTCATPTWPRPNGIDLPLSGSLPRTDGHLPQHPNGDDNLSGGEQRETDLNVEIGRCFLRLANLDNGAFERLSRYETALWRQISQILLTLDFLRR